MVFRSATSRLVKDWTAPDEQVEVFRVIDGQLVVPGNDPMELVGIRQFYRLEKDGWKKYRTLPNGIQNFDMIKFDGVLYAALGTEYGAVVVGSDDNGMTWRKHPLLPVIGGFYARAHSLFVLSGRLHASVTGRMGGSIFVLTKEASGRCATAISSPASPNGFRFSSRLHAISRARRLHRKGTTGARAPAARRIVRRCESAECAGHRARARRVPRDIVADAKRLFVLATERTGDGYDNHLFETGDLLEWREAFRFRTATFARAFEIPGGDFYFGLGTNHDDVHPETGGNYACAGSTLRVSARADRVIE